MKHLNDSKAFIEYSQSMDDIYNNVDDYNPSRKRKILIAFHDMIADIMTNKEFQATMKDLIIRCSNFDCIYHPVLFFGSKSSQSKFYILLNNEDLQKRKLQNIATNRLADID